MSRLPDSRTPPKNKDKKKMCGNYVSVYVCVRVYFKEMDITAQPGPVTLAIDSNSMQLALVLATKGKFVCG